MEYGNFRKIEIKILDHNNKLKSGNDLFKHHGPSESSNKLKI